MEELLLSYYVFLVLIGFPLLISEILIGRTVQSNQYRAFRILGKNKFWKYAGKNPFLLVLLLAHFSVVAGWMLGYLIEAILGNLNFENANQALLHFDKLSYSAI